MTNLFKDFHRLCALESQIQAQDFTLKAENAALKEQVAQLKSSVQHEADCVDSAAAEINRQADENDKLKETIAQQAEAIRVKDDLIESQAAEIANLQSLWTIAHAERSEAMNELAKTRSICDQMGDALEEAMYSNSTQRSIDKSVAAKKAWRAMK